MSSKESGKQGVEKTEMEEKRQPPSRWYYSIAVLVLLIGVLTCAWVFMFSGITMYPTMIADAYGEEQHRLRVPGSRNVKLTRTGAYGIYYENKLAAAVDSPKGKPTAIDCYLTSKATGAKIRAVPDYMETNKYWSKDQLRSGVLIMSITVDEPDIYRFACQFKDGRAEPEITVALGPNYVWEFLRVAGKIALSMFIGMTTLCGSALVGMIVFVIIAIKRGGL